MTPGPRRMCTASKMMSTVTPHSSAMTPKLLIRAITLTPIMLMMVVNTTRPAASSRAFLAPPGVATSPMSALVPMISKAAEKGGEGLGDLLGPLVDRPRQRVLPGQLGEAQRDQHLAGEHGGPGPDEGRGAGAEAE